MFHVKHLGVNIMATMKVFGLQTRPEILQSVISEPEFRKEIARVFNIANKRIARLKSSNVSNVSPAYEALKSSGITHFSLRDNWDNIKTQYGLAVSYINQPTSTLGGTNNYIKTIASRMHIPVENMKKIMNVYTAYSEKTGGSKTNIYEVARYLNEEETQETLNDMFNDAIESIGNIDNLVNRIVDHIEEKQIEIARIAEEFNNNSIFL